MKRLLAATAISIAAFAAPAAATTQAVWEGFLYLTSVSGTAGVCTDMTGPGGGQNTVFFASAYHTVFKPANVADNGTDTKLLMITNRSALHHIWKNKEYGNGSIPGTGFGGTANIFTWSSTFSSATISPSAPTTSTQTVVLKATITNFFNNAGCTAHLSGSLSHRPNTTY